MLPNSRVTAWRDHASANSRELHGEGRIVSVHEDAHVFAVEHDAPPQVGVAGKRRGAVPSGVGAAAARCKARGGARISHHCESRGPFIAKCATSFCLVWIQRPTA